MKNENYKLRCFGCRKIVAEKDSVSVCPDCGEALAVEFDFAKMKKHVAAEFKKDSPISAKKYLPFFPLGKKSKIISLGEGGTPLVEIKKIAPNLFVKNEGMNPTGVFKDRGSLVEISKALELKSRAVVVASTGNMAASVAAYSALADLPCFVLIPENTPLGKLAQAMNYGARVLSIRGTYSDCCELASKMAKKYGFYLAGDYVFRTEGQKTIAFEIVEQLNWRVPDAVVVPVGCGTNLAAIWKGFVEFRRLGFTDSLPKMIAVQPSGCSTVVAALEKNSRKAKFVAHPATICSAVGIGRPLDDLKSLAAVRESGGVGIAVADAEVAAAQKKLGEAAIFTEPSGALPLAAIRKLRAKKILRKSDIVVLVATGTGLKDPRAVLAAHPRPPAVEPELAEIDRFLKYKLYAIRSAGFAERQKILFRKKPTLAKLRTTIKKEFAADLKNSHLAETQFAIETFLAKGKIVAKADLQNLVEEVLGDLTHEKKVMRVRDFELSVRRKKRPRARVEVEFLGKKLSAESDGVGPVDAVISAIRKALKKNSPLREKLVDFEVFVDADGVDATTEVKMRLEDSQKNSVAAIANSPDIITAAVAAFEKGYNILFWKGEKKK